MVRPDRYLWYADRNRAGDCFDAATEGEIDAY